MIISLFETVRLSVSISPRNLYKSLKSIKEIFILYINITIKANNKCLTVSLTVIVEDGDHSDERDVRTYHHNGNDSEKGKPACPVKSDYVYLQHTTLETCIWLV